MTVSELCPATEQKCQYRVHLNRVLANLEIVSSELDVSKMPKRAKSAVQEHLDSVGAKIADAESSEVAKACSFIEMCGIMVDLTGIQMVKNEDLNINPTAKINFNGEI